MVQYPSEVDFLLIFLIAFCIFWILWLMGYRLRIACIELLESVAKRMFSCAAFML